MGFSQRAGPLSMAWCLWRNLAKPGETGRTVGGRNKARAHVKREGWMSECLSWAGSCVLARGPCKGTAGIANGSAGVGGTGDAATLQALDWRAGRWAGWEHTRHAAGPVEHAAMLSICIRRVASAGRPRTHLY